MEFFWALAFLLIHSIDKTNGNCEGSLDLENGRIFNTVKNFAIFRCNLGYILQGNTFHSCYPEGRLRGEKPFCASEFLQILQSLKMYIKITAK